MSDDLAIVLGIFAGVIAFGLLFIAIAAIRGRMARGWSRTEGLVVNRDGSTGGMPAPYPTFRWRDQHGHEHQRTSAMRASLGPAPGTPVTVLYDPDEPSRAMIDSLAQSGRIFYYIGGAVVVIAIVVGGYIGYLTVAIE